MNRFECLDCDIDTFKASEYYMVQNRVWAATGLGPDDGMLCIGCLEHRLGFILEPPDFIDAPAIHDPRFAPLSDRLRNRLYLTDPDPDPDPATPTTVDAIGAAALATNTTPHQQHSGHTGTAETPPSPIADTATEAGL